jgi:hypothetical protein
VIGCRLVTAGGSSDVAVAQAPQDEATHVATLFDMTQGWVAERARNEDLKRTTLDVMFYATLEGWWAPRGGPTTPAPPSLSWPIL